MKWSWKLGEFAGIGVFVHTTFFLLIGWVALSHWIQGQSAAAMLAGIGFILAMFGCVVLHEFGHALTARKYGIKTRDITLLPIGGVARLERMPDDPIQELWVALAGPAVNVVIAMLLYLWLHFTASLQPLTNLSLTGGPFVERLMVLNLFLVGFNMLPAFPHGRRSRAPSAFSDANGIHQGNQYRRTNPFLLFIALFVWMGAEQEASMTQMKSASSGIPVGRAMITEFQSLSPGDSLGRAVELILTGSQQDFPVEQNGTVVGVLTRADLLRALAKDGKNLPVSEVMEREFQMVDSSEMLETGFMRLQKCQCHTLPVTHNGRLVGLVTMDNVGEFVSVQAALKSFGGNGGK